MKLEKLDRDAIEWMAKNESKLSSPDRGKRRLRYVGSTNDIANVVEISPRQGSHVYVVDEFTMEVAQTKQSEIDGAPTMPVWQWYRCRDMRTGIRQ
jgi:hypothetical protein